MGLMGLLMACYGGLWGILHGLTKSTDHPSRYSYPKGPKYPKIHAYVYIYIYI